MLTWLISKEKLKKISKWSVVLVWKLLEEVIGIILDKYIYSLVQAVRQYNKKALDIQKKEGFAGSNINHGF